MKLNLTQAAALAQIVGTAFMLWMGFRAATSGEALRATENFSVAALLILAGVFVYRAIHKHLSDSTANLVRNVPETKEASVPEPTLQQKVHSLGCDLAVFLREKGPPPFPEVAYQGEFEFAEYRERRNAYDLLKRKDPTLAEKALTANEQWIDSVFHGYARLFAGPVKAILHEVAEHGFDSMSGGWDDLHENHLDEVGPQRARLIANHMLHLAARIEAKTLSAKN